QSSSPAQTIHATIDAQFDTISATSPNAAPVTINNLVTKGTLDTAGGPTDIHLSADAKTGNNNPATITAPANGLFFHNGQHKPHRHPHTRLRRSPPPRTRHRLPQRPARRHPPHHRRLHRHTPPALRQIQHRRRRPQKRPPPPPRRRPRHPARRQSRRHRRFR